MKTAKAFKTGIKASGPWGSPKHAVEVAKTFGEKKYDAILEVVAYCIKNDDCEFAAECCQEVATWSN